MRRIIRNPSGPSLTLSDPVGPMALRGRQIIGTAASCVGWVGLIVATATSDWVRTCDYGLATCLRTDELRSRGLWAECIISPSQSHCGARDQILDLPGETLIGSHGVVYLFIYLVS